MNCKHCGKELEVSGINMHGYSYKECSCVKKSVSFDNKQAQATCCHEWKLRIQDRGGYYHCDKCGANR